MLHEQEQVSYLETRINYETSENSQFHTFHNAIYEVKEGAKNEIDKRINSVNNILCLEILRGFS